MVSVQHVQLCPPAPWSNRRRDDYIMKWGRANEMGKNIPPHHHPHHPPPGPFIISPLPKYCWIIETSTLPASHSALDCLSGSVPCCSIRLPFSFFSCLPVCLSGVFKTPLCLPPPYLPPFFLFLSCSSVEVLQFFSAALIAICLWNQLSSLHLSFLLSLWIWRSEQQP